MLGFRSYQLPAFSALSFSALVCWGLLLGSSFAAEKESGNPPALAPKADRVVLKLHWYPQAQFAGYLVAQDKGFFRAAGLEDVEIRWSTAGERSLDTLDKVESAFCTGWLCDAIVRRSKGSPIVHLSQITQKSAMLLVTRREYGITTPADMTGRRVALWGGDFDVLPMAFFNKYQVKPEIVPQSASMVPFLRGAVNIASAMQYNEYHKLLEAGLRAEDLLVFNFADYGFDFPEDGLYCHERTWREQPARCAAIMRAVQQGWDYALENNVEALDVVMDYCRRAEMRTSRNHQQWMLRSMSDLIRFRAGGKRAPWGELPAAVYQGVGEELRSQGLLKTVPPFEEFHPAETQRKSS